MKVISSLRVSEDLCYLSLKLRLSFHLQKSNFHPRGKSVSSIDSVIYGSTGRSHPKHETKPPGSVFIPCVKGISENFRRIENRSNIRTVFKTKHALMEFTHGNQTGKDSTTEGVLCL